MRWFIIIVIFVLVFQSVIIVSASASVGPKIDPAVISSLNENLTVEVIVTINENQSSIFDLKGHMDDSNIKKIKESNESKNLSGGFKTELDKKELETLVNNGKVLSIEPIVSFSTFLDKSIPLINASDVWFLQDNSINLTGKGQTVCVIDTGVNFSHHDLIGKNLTCNIYCNPNGNPCVENCSVTDLNGHGTHLAGIVSANGNLKGVSKEANLIGVKIFSGSSESDASTASLKNGIDWCVSNSEQYNISVISLSLGTANTYPSYCDYDSPSLNNSFNDAFNKNISIVVASGNEANYGEISLPACLPKAIPVGDVYSGNFGGLSWGEIGSPTCTDSTTFVDKIVCHSNRNSLVKLLAPGALINSTWFDGGYSYQGGTSMAAPHVAGAIALLNQYLNLTGKTRTPKEIEGILNSTGKILFDTQSGLNYSRINVLNAIFSLDNYSPIVNLTYPLNGSYLPYSNQTFRCNASDLDLKNVSLILWNSSGIYYNASLNVSGGHNSLEVNVSNVSSDIYYWNCLYFDQNNNYGLYNTNNTLDARYLNTYLDNPSNNYYTNKNNVSFNCSANSAYNLSNVSFYLWNSSGLIYSKFLNVSGLNNLTNFSYYFTSEGNYYWNCKFSSSENITAFSNSNSSITYDLTNPIINILNPDDGYQTSGQSNITFYYNISDNTNYSSCNLIINDVNYSNLSIVLTNQTNNITESLSPGQYNWSINCSDLAGNPGNISSYNLLIINPAPVIISSGSGGGGGGGGSGGGSNQNIYSLSQSQIDKGIDKILIENDKVNFDLNISDGKKENHSIMINSIGNNSVFLTIRSNPINLTLNSGDEYKLNLNSKEYYDLYIKINSIIGGKVNLSIKGIHELILTKNNLDFVNSSNESDKNNSTNITNNGIYETYIWLVIVIIAFVFIYFLMNIKKKEVERKIKKKLDNFKYRLK